MARGGLLGITGANLALLALSFQLLSICRNLGAHFCGSPNQASRLSTEQQRVQVLNIDEV
jgi:hypothetical protein